MMFRRFVFILVVVFSANWAFAQATQSEPETGDALAEQLRSMQPEESTEITGVLKIRASKRRADIPVLCRVVTNGNSWQVIYETRPTASCGAEKLIVIRSVNQPNKYLYSCAPSPGGILPDPKPLVSSDANIPFAGSDFWLTELGFEFLRWPIQRKLPGEMRIGQPCYVLESINPEAPLVVRVKSWIEKESGGLLIAEAYDRNKKIVKEFSLAGSSFKKVNGRWQLKKMKISSPQTESETVLEFDLPKD